MSPFFYHRAPNFSIDPDSPIAPKLGSIFPNLEKLTSPLNQHDSISIPGDLINANEADDFHDTVGRKITANIGVHTELAQGLPLSGNIIFSSSKDKNCVYKCSNLKTTEFDPIEEYILRCIHASQRVQNYVQDCFRGRKKIYMITGLKTATNFSMTLTKNMEQGPTLNITADGTAHGIPVSGGPQMDFAAGTSRDLASGKSPQIVFAYRAIKIRPRRDGTVGYKDIKGGQYSLDKDEDEDEGWTIEGLDADDLAEEPSEAVKVEVVKDDV